MLSIQDLISEVYSIKVTSDELASMVGTANIDLTNQSSTIADLVQGSYTGQDAVMALSAATQSLSDAVSSIRTLSRTCSDCIDYLSK